MYCYRERSLLTAYAVREWSLVFLIGAVVTLAVGWQYGWWALVPLLVTLGLLSFYRDPPRTVPKRPDAVLAPADGRIVRLESGRSERGEPVLVITIFLSVLDVHVNRSPCAGRVLEVTHKPGKFINALRSEADVRNESNTLLIETKPPLPGPIRVRQIAGRLARRIVCGVQPGDPLDAGERYGMIKLGSRTELTLPDDGGWTPCVRLGQHVRGGVSVLATYSAPASG